MNGLENAQKANFTEVEKTKETFNLNELEVTALGKKELKEVEGGTDLLDVLVQSATGYGWYVMAKRIKIN